MTLGDSACFRWQFEPTTLRCTQCTTAIQCTNQNIHKTFSRSATKCVQAQFSIHALIATQADWGELWSDELEVGSTAGGGNSPSVRTDALHWHWRSNGPFFAAGLVWVQAPSGHAKAMFCQQGGSLNSSLNKPRDNTKPNKRRSPRSQRSLNSGLMCSKLGASQSLTRLQWTRLQTANSACCFSLIFGKLRTTKIHFTLARPALASSNSTWLQVVEKTQPFRIAGIFVESNKSSHSKLGSVRLHQWLSAFFGNTAFRSLRDSASSKGTEVRSMRPQSDCCDCDWTCWKCWSFFTGPSDQNQQLLINIITLSLYRHLIITYEYIWIT